MLSKPLLLSSTKIKDFKRCKKKYNLKYKSIDDKKVGDNTHIWLQLVLVN